MKTNQKHGMSTSDAKKHQKYNPEIVPPGLQNLRLGQTTFTAIRPKTKDDEEVVRNEPDLFGYPWISAQIFLMFGDIDPVLGASISIHMVLQNPFFFPPEPF